jgi:trigger factor
MDRLHYFFLFIMQISVKKLPHSQVELKITVPWEEWQKEIAHATKGLAKSVNLPGFRPGTAPRAILEKRLGKATILEEAAEHVVRHSYSEALKKENIQAIGEPKVTLEKLIEGEDFEYQITTAVLPEVVIGKYAKAVKKLNVDFKKSSDEVEEKEIMAELERLAEMRAPIVTVRLKAKIGDTVVIDFSVMQDGVPIENGTSSDHALVLGKDTFIPGFEEKLLDMGEGEEKKFTLTFPSEYHARHLAGKEALFSVTVKLVQERQIPPIDEAFAKQLGNFESLEKVKESLRHGMLEEKKLKRKNERRTDFLDTLVKETTIEVPEILLEQELGRMLGEFEMRAQSMGMTLDGLLEQAKKTKEDLKKEWQEQARKRVLAYLLLEHVAKTEEIVADPSAIEEEMNKVVHQYQSVDEAKKLDMTRLYQAVSEQLRNEKVFEYLESL